MVLYLRNIITYKFHEFHLLKYFTSSIRYDVSSKKLFLS